jgi:hypothetical protein
MVEKGKGEGETIGCLAKCAARQHEDCELVQTGTERHQRWKRLKERAWELLVWQDLELMDAHGLPRPETRQT